MANATFPVATKAHHFEIDGKRYQKVTFEDAKQWSNAIQAAYNCGNSLGWFVPLDAKRDAKPATAAT